MYNEKCDCGFSERDKSLGQGDPRNLIHCLNKEARVCDRQALQTAHAPLKNSVNIKDPKQLLLRAHHLWLYVVNETVLDMNESVADVGEKPWHPLIFWRKLRSEGRKKVFLRHRNPPPPLISGSSWPCPTPLSEGLDLPLVIVLCGVKALYITAILRNVVGKYVRATIPKGNMGYDQYAVPDTVAVERTFVAFL